MQTDGEANGTNNSVNYKKAGFFYIFGSLFNKGIAFLTVPVFTRLLSTEDYGIISTYNSWVGIGSVCISFTLYMGVRQAFVDYPDRIDDFLSTITLFITAFWGCVSLGSVLVGNALSVSILLPLLCMLQSYSSALIENFSMYLMMQYRYKMRTFFMVMPNFVSVIVSVLVINFVISRQLYMGRIVPTVLITGCFGIFVAVAVFRKSRKFDYSLLKYGLTISAPLIMHGISLTILGQSDRIMITSLVGSSETGIYSVVYNFSMIASALTTALSGIWSPWFLMKIKNHSNDDLRDIKRMIKIYVLFMTVVMCSVILIAPEVLKIVAPESYWSGMDIIPPIVLANFVTFVYTFYVDVEHFHKKTGSIAVYTMAAALSNIILNFACIPLFGYEAAAYTTVASYLLSLLLHYLKAMKLEPKMIKLAMYIPEVFMIVGMSIVYYICIQTWIIRWAVAIVMALVFFVYAVRKYNDIVVKFKG